MFKNILAFFLATILALGCGGGGGGGSTMPRRPAILPEIPLQTLAHAPQAPIVDFDGSLHVGAGVAPEINQLSKTGARGDMSISSGSVRDGAGRDALVEFLKPFVEVGPSKSIAGLPTYSSPPVVRAARGTSAEHMDYAVRAVQIINAYLPHDKRISFSGNPSPPRVGTDEVPPGEIFIDFAPHREWTPPSTRPVGQEPRGTTRSGSIYYEYPETGETTYGGVEHSRIWINSDKIREFSGEAMILLLAHELLHALGFRGHPDPVRYHDSVTRSRVPRVFSERILGPVDADAILAIYSGYEPGDTSVESLGPWSDTSFHLRGDLKIAGGDVSFGVASRNGLAQPWASGPTPSVNMVDNEELSGVVTWTGALLGITPSAETVVGDSRLAIDLADLDGQLDITNMQFDGGGTWGDGDLGYSVEVRGNTFVQTGGDAGQVTGAFFGPRHEGMGGVLERHDLSAAFGGKR